MNDTPVGCQNREWTEPQRDRPPLRILSGLVRNKTCHGETVGGCASFRSVAESKNDKK
jgi:hypothetical protein